MLELPGISVNRKKQLGVLIVDDSAMARSVLRAIHDARPRTALRMVAVQRAQGLP